jgi:hypothetical protein
MVILSEETVEKRLREWLPENGYPIVQPRQGPHGPDIVAENERNKLIIEVQGNKKPSGEEFTSSQYYTHFRRAVGQICTRMDNENDEYAVGIPKCNIYEDCVEKIQLARKRLKLRIFIVDRDECSEYHDK